MARRQAAPERTAQDRDSALEKTYTFHASYHGQSPVAYVAENREELTLAFFDWMARAPFKEGIIEMLLRYEEERFGRVLEPAAHGMLLFSVKHRQEHMRPPGDITFASDEERVRVEEAVVSLPVIEGEAAMDRVERIALASGLIVPSKAKAKARTAMIRTMPDIPVAQSRQPGEDDDGPLDWGEDEV